MEKRPKFGKGFTDWFSFDMIEQYLADLEWNHVDIFTHNCTRFSLGFYYLFIIIILYKKEERRRSEDASFHGLFSVRIFYENPTEICHVVDACRLPQIKGVIV